MKVGEKFKVDVSFENPLMDTLGKCELRVEGPGLQRPVIYKQPYVNLVDITYILLICVRKFCIKTIFTCLLISSQCKEHVCYDVIKYLNLISYM